MGAPFLNTRIAAAKSPPIMREYMGILQPTAAAYIKGAASFIPGVANFANRRTGGTTSARYCYTVWMRHFVMCARRNEGLSIKSVAELGPGESLGIGIAAILSGCQDYTAFDVKAYASSDRNLRIFDELTELFRNRSRIPDDSEFPQVHPSLEDWAFPSDLLTDDALAENLSPERLWKIRSSLEDQAAPASMIRYVAPWYASRNVRPHTIDVVLSQAVLEHVDRIHETYEALRQWLRPTGIMTHTIDYRSHGLTRDWYGHWTVPSLAWSLVRGRRPYLINRRAHSDHVHALRRAGFRVSGEQLYPLIPLPRSALAREFLHLTEQDLCTSGSYLQCVMNS